MKTRGQSIRFTTTMLLSVVAAASLTLDPPSLPQIVLIITTSIITHIITYEFLKSPGV